MPYFEPIAKPGEHVMFWMQDKQLFVKVVVLEPLPGLVYDFGSISAGGNTVVEDAKFLYMPDGHFAQWRPFIITDNLELEIYQPPASGRFTTRTQLLRIFKPSGITDYQKWFRDFGKLYEFYVVEDRTPIKIIAYNVGTADLSEAKVMFIGWKFRAELVDYVPERYVTIPVGSLATTKSIWTKTAEITRA